MESANASSLQAVEGAINGSLQALTTNATGVLTGGTSPLPAANYTLVMGGSGTPIPGINLIDAAVQRYIEPFYSYDPAGVQGLSRPKSCIRRPISRPYLSQASVAEGVQILDNMLVGANPPYAGLLNNAANTVNVFGYSQSAAISSLEMRALTPRIRRAHFSTS